MEVAGGKKLAKKPFSIRTEQYNINRYKVLCTVLNIDNDKLLTEMLANHVETLTEDEKKAYDALLKIWKEDS
jgi:hypothetical protein